MIENFREKVTIITGGSRGIGKACCLVFAEAGSNIVFTYNKSKREAEELEKKLKKTGC